MWEWFVASAYGAWFVVSLANVGVVSSMIGLRGHGF